MAKPNLFLEYFKGYSQPYKLMALNLFDYLQLVEFVNDHKLYFYSASTDKQTLTIYGYIDIDRVTELITLLPAGIVMERD